MDDNARNGLKILADQFRNASLESVSCVVYYGPPAEFSKLTTGEAFSANLGYGRCRSQMPDGRHRTVQFFGKSPATDGVARLAANAGALLDADSNSGSIIDGQHWIVGRSVHSPDRWLDAHNWISTVFSLAWSNPPGYSLHSTRGAWEGKSDCGEIEDFATASAEAIRLMLDRAAVPSVASVQTETKRKGRPEKFPDILDRFDAAKAEAEAAGKRFTQLRFLAAYNKGKTEKADLSYLKGRITQRKKKASPTPR